MLRCAFTPYEGKKPYIFISYAHKDSDRVFPILEELDRRGYRVWYDDGIAPGSEWPENIAQHLDGCSLALAFISPSSIASANCRREVTFALSKRKNFLGIMLEPTEMSLGMEMQLSAQQCIMKYTYATDAEFMRKVCSCPDLQPCLGEPKVVAAPVAPAAAPAPVAASVAAPAPAAVNTAPAQQKKPMDKKLVGIIASVAAAVAVVALVLVLLLGGREEGPSVQDDPDDTSTNQSSQQTDPSDSRPEQTDPDSSEPDGVTDEWSLYYYDQVITAQEVAYISQQKQLGMLTLENCVIQPNVLNQLTLADTLIELVMVDCAGVSNLSALSGLNKLETLKLVNCDLQQNVLPDISSDVLTYVDISGNSGVYDLSVFEKCTAIEEIYFENSGVDSVETLAMMQQLRIVVGNYSYVADLSPICNLTTLYQIEFAGCGITEVADIYSIRLEILNLAANELYDTEFLKYCTVLREVDLSFTNVFYVDELEKSKDTLCVLNVAGNGHLYDHNLEFLNSCTQLRELNMDGLFLSSGLNFINELYELEYLSAVNCYLSDISALKKLTKLTYLNLAFNNISDITVLGGLTAANMILDLSFNDKLTDVSALNEGISYTVLNLTNENLDPYTVPPVWGPNLLIAQHESWEDPNCMNEDNRLTFVFIDVVNCPLDKVIAMENRFGANRLNFVDDLDAYIARLEELGLDCSYMRFALTQE